MAAAECRGDFHLGSACGECPRCARMLRALVVDFTDPEICRYDHNNKCQTHWLATRPCPHEIGQKIVEVFGLHDGELFIDDLEGG